VAAATCFSRTIPCAIGAVSVLILISTSRDSVLSGVARIAKLYAILSIEADAASPSPRAQPPDVYRCH